MSTRPEAASDQLDEPPDTGEVSLRDLTERIARLAGDQGPPDRAMRELAELEVASEELRVVEEEVRVQQEQLESLLTRFEAEHSWRSQLSSLVPIGLCVTDDAGKILDANPALATQLQVGLHRLRGKPLSVFLDADDVGRFRSGLRALTTGGVPTFRTALILRGRRSESPAELFGFPDSAEGATGAARVQWVLVPEFRSREPDVLAGIPVPGGETVPGRPAREPRDGGDGTLQLATALAALAALPATEADPQRLLSRIAGLVRAAVPAAAWVSCTLGSPLAPLRVGSDSSEAQDFDGRQLRAQEGPCADAHGSGSTVLCGDVTADPRWPALARLVGASSVRSVLAVPVRETVEVAGALNLYSPRPHAFDPESRRIAELVATAVTGALQSAAERRSLRELAAHLETALTSRATIDQAKGVLMARLGVSADEAFTRLVALSNRLNVKLRDLAALVLEGHLDALVRATG